MYTFKQTINVTRSLCSWDCVFFFFSIFFYLQYTNLRGRQVRLLPLFQLFLRVDLPIKQSDRKAPDKYINKMIKLTKLNKNRRWVSDKRIGECEIQCTDVLLLTRQWSRRYRRPGRIWRRVRRWRETARLQDPPIPRWTDWPRKQSKDS